MLVRTQAASKGQPGRVSKRVRSIPLKVLDQGEAEESPARKMQRTKMGTSLKPGRASPPSQEVASPQAASSSVKGTNKNGRPKTATTTKPAAPLPAKAAVTNHKLRNGVPSAADVLAAVRAGVCICKACAGRHRPHTCGKGRN